MSNYLTIIAKTSKFTKIKEWVNLHLADAFEVAQTKISPNTHLIYISKGASEDFLAHRRFAFKGVCVDHGAASIVFGGGGRNDMPEKDRGHALWPNPLEGCYFSLEWTGDTVRASNDAFAMCPMNYFHENDIVGISDSIFILTELRKFLDLPCTVNEEVAYARAWSNTMAGQLLSEDTLVSQIKYIQTGSYLEVRIGAGISATMVKRNIDEMFGVPGGMGYESVIQNAVQRCASLIHTLSSISVNSVRIALSGGTDSRVVLACALASPISKEQAIFNCTNTAPSHEKDYAVVSDLSKRFNFPLGFRAANIKRNVSTKISSPLNLWFLGNAGLYDFLVAPDFYLKSVGVFSFGGFGAEIYKGMYGWRAISRIAARIEDKNISEAFATQCEKGIGRLGVSKDDKTGSEWHYLGFRNAIHAGRSVLTTMVGMRPLMQKELVGLVRSESNPFPAPMKTDKSIMTDILIAANPELAKIPFDHSDKDMDEHYVNTRARFFGGGLDASDLQMYKIYGDFQRVENGSPLFFEEVAAKKYSLELSAESVVSLMRSGFDKISSETLRKIYEPGFKAAVERLTLTKGSLSHTGSYPGKLMSFLLLD